MSTEEDKCEISEEERCPNYKTCPMRKKHLESKPWLNYYCYQNPELCQRSIKKKNGDLFDPEMLPDGSIYRES